MILAPRRATRAERGVVIAAAMCRRFEGFRARPYLCPAGVPTIGYGATHYLDGQRVRLADPSVTREIANALLLDMIQRTYLPAVLALCPAVDSAHRLGALVDFCFNLGAGNLRASTLRRRVNAGQWDAAAVEIKRWCRAGGRVLPGLVVRRAAEAEMLVSS